MEEYVYIILVVIWLLVSILRRRPKKDATKSKPQTAPQEKTSAPAEKDMSMEEMLEEFLGGGKKKSRETSRDKPVDEPVYNAPERREVKTTAYQTPEKQETAFEEFEGETVAEDHAFVSEGKIKTIDELIESHKKEEALRLAREQEEAGIEPAEGIPEFDLRSAVIFSEILNRKYQ